MSGLVSVLSVSLGTLLAILVFVGLVFWYVKDITQKKHTVLRNYRRNSCRRRRWRSAPAGASGPSWLRSVVNVSGMSYGAIYANTCPTGVTTHNPRLQRGLVVTDKAERVAHYCRNMNREIDMIAHACGLRHAREFRRDHVRIVQPGGQSVAFNMLYPYPAEPA